MVCCMQRICVSPDQYHRGSGRMCSKKFAARMLEKGVYVVGFFYPVVPQGAARIRTQVSAAHSREDLQFAIRAFTEVKSELGL